jgi:acyl carrier protein
MEHVVETTEAKIRRIISFNVGIDDDQITSNSHLVKDLGIDSVDQMEIVMSCEEQFEIEIADDEAAEIETFQQLVAYVEKKRAH